MTIHLINTTCGLVPQYDEDFDEKKKLKPGQFYTAEIKLQRNPLFHRLFFALLNCAWDYLPEAVEKGFRSKEAFRKYLTVAAGYYEPFFSPTRGEWMEIPKSISFDNMDDAEFHDLYERVKDVIFNILGSYVSREEIESNLINF